MQTDGKKNGFVAFCHPVGYRISKLFLQLINLDKEFLKRKKLLYWNNRWEKRMDIGNNGAIVVEIIYKKEKGKYDNSVESISNISL